MKRIALAFLLFIVAVPVFASPVTPDRAASVAGTFMNRRPETLRLVANDVPATKSMGAAASSYYVYKSEGRPGFVIVAGDDAISPVIAWSDDSDFVLDDRHGNVKAWMDMWDGIVNEVRRRGMCASASVKREWSDFDSGVKPSSAGRSVLLETALWDQGSPYNRYCPDFDGRTITGCVATAAAIALRYYKWPDRGVGTLPDYSYTDEDGIIRKVEGIELGHEYQWDKMPLRYDSSWTEEQKDAVAVLMHEMGVMAQASYGKSSTSASTGNVAYGYINHMKYDPSLTLRYKKYTPKDEWLGMIMDHLDNIGPLVYAANVVGGSGHCFILDGYNESGQIHINWGWGGSSNGYYTFPGFGEFTTGHEVVLGMVPDHGGRPEDILVIEGYGAGRGMTASIKAFYPGVHFSVAIESLHNEGMATFSGDIALVRINSAKEIVEVLDMVRDIYVGWSGKDLSFPDVVLSDISVGDKLSLAIRSGDNQDWKLVYGNEQNGTVSQLKLADSQSIDETTSLDYSLTDAVMKITLKKGVSYLLADRNGKVFSSGKTEENGDIVTIDCSGLPKDIYVLTLEKTIEKKQITLKIGRL